MIGLLAVPLLRRLAIIGAGALTAAVFAAQIRASGYAACEARIRQQALQHQVDAHETRRQSRDEARALSGAGPAADRLRRLCAADPGCE